MFSTVYNQSYEFLKFAYTGLSNFVAILFKSLREILAERINVSPETFFPNVSWLDYSVFNFIVGGGLLLYIGVVLWTFLADTIS